MNGIEQESKEQLNRLGIEEIGKETMNDYMQFVKELVKEIAENEVQDVIIVENEKIEVKIKGVQTVAEHLTPWERDVFNVFIGNVGQETVKGRTKIPKITGEYWIDTQITEKLLEKGEMSHDFSMAIGDTKSLRLHLYSVYSAVAPNKQAFALSIRVINREIPSWEELNLPSYFKGTTHKENGLVLIAGHVGSGKSTTVASLIKDINLTSLTRKSMLTVEEPIEYVHKSGGSKVVQKEVGVNTPSFSKATDDAMRENADVIVIGELKSKEEMDNALRLVEIGKLVFATIHSNSVIDTPDRFVNVFPGDVQENIRDRLASNVICIMHQNLETVEGKQYPIVEGFFARNEAQRLELYENFTRTGLNSIMNSGTDWVRTKEQTFKELTGTNTFTNLGEAERLLTN